jgi:putative ABC transport system permease protein
MTVALAGLAVGWLSGLLLRRAVSGMLFGVSAVDPWTLAFCSLVLVVVTLAACYLPARRASRVDPIVALRYE